MDYGLYLKIKMGNFLVINRIRYQYNSKEKYHKVILKTNIIKRKDFVYHIDLDNKVYKGKIGSVPNFPREFIAQLQFNRKKIMFTF